jgi:hypothetical protein
LQGPTAGRLRFQLAALHPAYPIKCRTSTQRTQAPESVDIRKRFACRALADRPRQCRALRRRAFARSARTTAPRSSRAVMGASPAHRQAAYGSSTSSLSPTRRSSVRPRSHRRAAYGSSTSRLVWRTADRAQGRQHTSEWRDEASSIARRSPSSSASQTSQMRKERPFRDGLAYGSNRPFAALRGRSYERARSARKRSFG